MIEIEIPLNTPIYLALYIYIYIILNILNIKIFNIEHKKKKIKIVLSVYDLTYSLKQTYEYLIIPKWIMAK